MGYRSALRAILTTAGRFKKYLSLLVIAATIGVFAYYVQAHPQSIAQLRHINPLLLLALLGLFGLMLASLSVVYRALVRLCGQAIGQRENLLLTCYSTLVNFFGPLQSGPGFRAAYLKKRHNVSLRSYTLATVLYYALYGFFSAVALLAGGGLWWAVAALTVVLAGAAAAARRRLSAPRFAGRLHLSPRVLLVLALATLAQVAAFALIYFVELRSVNPGVTASQALAYTGTANLSLFAALTPGAIGIREAFLVFTQNLHHISNADIVAASVLDRGVYVVFLGILFVAAVGAHAKRRLSGKTA